MSLVRARWRFPGARGAGKAESLYFYNFLATPSRMKAMTLNGNRRLAVFASGNGTNAERIIRHFGSAGKGIEVALLLCNKPGAPALERARRLGVETVVMGRGDFNDPQKLLPLLEARGVTHIVLSGFLLMVPKFLIERYGQRIYNLHPSLLPKFGGKGMYGTHVFEAVKAAGEAVTGITIHHVTEACDQGAVIFQASVEVLPTDSVDDIARKTHALEYRHFAEVIEAEAAKDF